MFQNTGAGTSGYILKSNGAAAPTWLQTLPIANGGTNVTSVTTTPTATAFAGWDANKNLSANSFIGGYASTATAAGTTTLTVGSAEQQFFTGATTQTVVLPAANTLALGQEFTIVNNSTGNVTVQNNGAVTVQTMAGGTSGVFTVTNVGSANGTWNDVSSGGVPSFAGLTAGGVGYATSTTNLTTTGAGTANQVLLSGGAAVPTWSTITMAGNAITYPAAGNLSTTGANDNTITGTNTDATAINLNVTGVNGGITLGANGTGVVTVNGTTPTITSPAAKGLLVEAISGQTTTLGNSAAASATTLQSGTGGIVLSQSGTPYGAGVVQTNASGQLSSSALSVGSLTGVLPIANGGTNS